MKRLLPVLLVLAAAVIGAIKLLPWWGSLALVVGLAATAKLAAGRLLKRVLIGAFDAKSAALRGAWATLNGVARANPPKPSFDEPVDLDEMESEGPLTWVHLDMTVHVPEENAGKTPFRLWEPGELCIVPVDARSGMDLDDEEGLGTVSGVEVQQDGHWVTVEGKLQGTQRIRLHAGLKQGVDAFKLRYYFEVLGNRAPS